MSSNLNVLSVNIMNNPAKPTDCIQIEVTFEVYETVVDGESILIF